MNTNQFMDKQIMDLSNSQSNNDFINLMNPPDDHHVTGGDKREDILPSYDFQPIRPASSSPSIVDSGRNSADNKSTTNNIRVTLSLCRSVWQVFVFRIGLVFSLGFCLTDALIATFFHSSRHIPDRLSILII